MIDTSIWGGDFTPSTQPLTVDALMDALAETFSRTTEVDSLTMYVSVPTMNRMDRAWRRGDALRTLGIPYDSPKARRVKAVGNRWP